MIEMKDICKVYTVGSESVWALDHASLHIDPGEFVSIIGPSGSGKSTLMNIIGCLDVADSGEYLLDNTPIEDYTEKELARVRNHKIGFVFQSFNLIPKLSAEENVELPLIYQKVGKTERKKRVEQALEKVQLKNRAKHLPTELSGGQQQRVPLLHVHRSFWQMNRRATWTPRPAGILWGFFGSCTGRETPLCLSLTQMRWQKRPNG